MRAGSHGGQKMEHWLGNAKIDQLVFRAVKQVPGVGCRPITALVQHLADREGLVVSGQKLPDEDYIYISLLRLIQRGKAEKYVNLATGGIRYRAREYTG